MCRSYFSQTRSLRGTPPTHTQAARNQNEFKNNKARNHDLKRSRKQETRRRNHQFRQLGRRAVSRYHVISKTRATRGQQQQQHSRRNGLDRVTHRNRDFQSTRHVWSCSGSHGEIACAHLLAPRVGVRLVGTHGRNSCILLASQFCFTRSRVRTCSLSAFCVTQRVFARPVE